jgi:colanic acid/amylovoran biosynthesis glycosyltransferase
MLFKCRLMVSVRNLVRGRIACRDIYRPAPAAARNHNRMPVEMSPQKLLLVLPLVAYRSENQIFVDAQARNGLRLWLDNFDVLTLACPTVDQSPPSGFLPVDDERITFVALPAVYKPQRFVAALYQTLPTLRKIIAESDYLHFAIGGLFGDWSSVCAILARRSGRKFAVWTDRVESQVEWFQAKSKAGPRKPYYFALAALLKVYERKIIRMSSLGLFHGSDCYTAYSAYSSNSHLVHDIHLRKEDQISDAEIEARLRYNGPIRIAYAGRAHRDKGIFDWIEALSLAARGGIEFRATWFGDGPELESARQKVTDANLLNHVKLPGSMTDHSALMEKLRSSFDVFMFCHKTRESPRCLVEALMCGLPIIGYTSHYARGLIKKHGGGMLTSPGYPELLIDSLSQFSRKRDSITKKAQRDGQLYDDESVFRHRSDLMKAI